MHIEIVEHFYRILPWIIIGILISIFLIVVGIVAKTILRAIKNGNKEKVIGDVISILCILIAVVSWITNMGWYRFIMMMIALPFIHAVAFFFINHFSVAYMNQFRMLKMIIIFSYIFYLTGYIFLPDGGDIGPMYVFFGLVHSDSIIELCFVISTIGFLGNVACSIIQIIGSIKLKKSKTVK